MAFKINVDQAFKNLKLGASKLMGMKGLKLKEASPEILLGLGIITMTGAVVSGIMAARHHDEIIDDHNERLEEAKAEYLYPEDYDEENPNPNVEPIRRTEKEISRDVRREYCRTAAAMCRLYLPTMAFMAASTAFFIWMHNIQAGRIAGLSGVCAGLREYISQYEQRNIELNGEESHRMCKYGYKEIEIEEEDPDNGEKYKVKKKVPLQGEEAIEARDLKVYHDHLYWFTRQTSYIYKGRGMYDYHVLQIIERDLNDLLVTRGWVLVNDALIAMGMQPTLEGMVEGWVRGKGDRISLGLDAPENERPRNGYSNEPFFITLNVHGNAYGILKELEKERRAQSIKDAKETQKKMEAYA